MARSALQETQMLKLAKEALLKLSASGDNLLRRTEIFSVKQNNGPIEKMQGVTLRLLERAGAVVSVRSTPDVGRGTPILWGIDKAELAALANDPVKLAEMLFPAKAPPIAPEPEVASPAEPPAVPAEPSEAASESDDDDGGMLQEALLAILQTTKRLGESMAALNVTMRDFDGRLERVERGVAELLADTQPITSDQLAASVVAVLSLPRLNEAEAKALREGEELYYFNGAVPEPVRVKNVRVEPGHPVTVTVMRPGGMFTPVTPKHLSKRKAA